MPIYEYECDRCRKVHEVTQRFSDSPLSACPDCGSSGIRKLISLSSFALKGSGFYTTDYKRAGLKSESASSGTGSGASKASSDNR
jgi:putative FmdB family regulatory protein